VADLLECLIQIKGLSATPARLSSRARAAAGRGAAAQAVRVVSYMCTGERWLRECLRRTLGDEGSLLPVREGSDNGNQGQDEGDTLEERLAEFERRRGRVVEVLEQCSADELGRVGVLPSGRRVTVADLVAITLARDTDELAKLLP